MKKVSTKEAVEIIKEIENTFSVQSLSISGIDIWPVIRIHLAFSLDSIVLHSGNDKKSDGISYHLSGVLKSFWQKLRWYDNTSWFLKKSDVLFLTYSQSKHNRFKNKWLDSYVDPVISELEKAGKTFCKIEYSNDYEYRLPGYKASNLIQHHLFWNFLKARFRMKTILFDDQTKTVLNEVAQFLNRNGFDSDLIDHGFIKKRVSQILSNREYFKKLLRKVKPKVVIGSNYYGIEMAMNLACREYGIKSVDIQHGVQGKYHVAYGSWINVPASGYNLLPDTFAVWSDYEKNNIDDWSKSTIHDSIVIGNPLLNFYSKYKESNQLLLKELNREKINVLITLQPGRGLIELYKDLLNENDSNIHFWIRKHPVMGTDEVENIKKGLSLNSNYSFDLASDIPLHDLLQHMDVHITENSTVVIEADQYGMLNIVCHESGKDLYENYISAGKVKFTTDTKNIITQVANFKKHIKNNNNQPVSNDTISKLLEYSIINDV